MKKKFKGKRYAFNDSEVLICLISHFCKYCGSNKICLRKVKFKNNLCHLEKLCYSCLRHTDYLSINELPSFKKNEFKAHAPIRQSGCKTYPLSFKVNDGVISERS